MSARTRRQRLTSVRSLAWADRVVAAGFVAGALATVAGMSYRGPTWLAIAAAVVCNGSVAWRRSRPTLAAVAALVSAAAYQLTTRDQQGTFESAAVVLVFYIVGKQAYEHRDDRRTSLLLAGGLLVSVVTSTHLSGAPLAWLSLFVAPIALGAVVARRDRLSRALADAVYQLEEEQRSRAGAAASEERLRVARDLHDVVAHGVSVMVIQAGAARLVAATDAPTARSALQIVVASGREALTDLRRIMGALRRDAADDPWSSGLARLDQLLDRIRAAGVTTDLVAEGPWQELPPAIDVVAYRVVQEALTNVVKHAGPARAQVRIRVDATSLVIDVVDTGNADAGTLSPQSSQQGLVGMRERVCAYGGRLRTGRRPGGGFEVSAELPLRAVTSPPPHETSAPLLPGMAAARPWVDLLIAAAWFVALEAEALASGGPTGTVVRDCVVVGCMAALVNWRRRAPLVFMMLCGAGNALLSPGFNDPNKATLVGAFTLVVPLFTVAAWENRRRATVGLLLFAAGATVLAASQNALSSLGGAMVMGFLVWIAGIVTRAQRDVAAALVSTTELLKAEQDSRSRLAVASERTRIARELNALAARDVTAMVVQAEAAQQLFDRDHDAALHAIASIENAGREALGQLRRLLGVLRTPLTAPELAPQPGLHDLHALVQHARERGRAVALTVTGEPGPLTPGVDLVVYRVIEEALSDNANHGGRSPLDISVSFSDDRVELDVSGHVARKSPWPTPAIRERIALYDGEIHISDARPHLRRAVVTLPRVVEGAWA